MFTKYQKVLTVYRQASRTIPLRRFSLKQDNNPREAANQYKSQFDDLLGSSTKVTKEELDFIKRQEQAKKIADEAAQKQTQEMQERIAAKKAAEFDDLLSGKKTAKSMDEKNLQEIFREFYDSAKSIKFQNPGTGLYNSAKQSIGSLGSKLESRRQKYKKEHKEEVKSEQAQEEPVKKMEET